jgi:hypothetical protein
MEMRQQALPKPLIWRFEPLKACKTQLTAC